MFNQLTTWFAYPKMFWLAPALGFVLLAVGWGWRRRKRALAILGQSTAVRRLLLVEPTTRRLRHVCLTFGLVLLAVGTAGPQWGRELHRETAQGHDILLVFDVSRSMHAEQPSRLQRALRALGDLADHLQKRGGQRVALVVFAAQPHLAFPLTEDYDHLRHYLSQIEAGDVPVAVRPQGDNAPASGTRIGAALRLAIQARDAEAKLAPLVLLLSDGDDPARDEEWMIGVHEARAANVAIHTVGFGDPQRDSIIALGNDTLLFDGKTVRTRLEEDVLKEIARRTAGVYLPAHTGNLPLGSLIGDILRKQGANPDGDSAAPLPVYRRRATWFLWPALGLLTAALLLRARPKRQQARALRLAPALAVLLAIVSLSAGPLEDDLVRRGNAAFAQGDFDAALALYEKAESAANDPGLVAFDKAAAYYRLGRFRDAELHYLRCLEDDQAAKSRRAQAYFGLGITLVRRAEAKDRAALEQAIDAFASCLTLVEASSELATDAQYNLELARWLRLRAEPPDDKSNGDHPKPEPKTKPQLKPDDSKKTTSKTPERGDPDKSQSDKGLKKDQMQKKKDAHAGALHVIPDKPKLVPLPEEDTEAYLNQLAERILQERRAHLRQFVPDLPHVKDW